QIVVPLAPAIPPKKPYFATFERRAGWVPLLFALHLPQTFHSPESVSFPRDTDPVRVPSDHPDGSRHTVRSRSAVHFRNVRALPETPGAFLQATLLSLCKTDGSTIANRPAARTQPVSHDMGLNAHSESIPENRLLYRTPWTRTALETNAPPVC